MKIVFVMCYFMIFLLYILFLMKNMETHMVGSSTGDNDMCLVDSASTLTILKDKKILFLFNNARIRCEYNIG